MYRVSLNLQIFPDRQSVPEKYPLFPLEPEVVLLAFKRFERVPRCFTMVICALIFILLEYSQQMIACQSLKADRHQMNSS